MHVPISVLTGIEQKSNIYFEQKLFPIGQPLFLCSRAASGQMQHWVLFSLKGSK